MNPRHGRVMVAMLALALMVQLAWLPQAFAQEEFCGITPKSAHDIATEVGWLSGKSFDSVSAAYYVSVLAARLSPYYVVFFSLEGRVVGEIEIDMCGRQDTPHPGMQYAEDSDLKLADLLVEPDAAFAAIRKQTAREPVFGTRIFPYGLTDSESDLTATDFWWMILDDQADWHYMTKTGVLKGVRDHAPESSGSASKAPDKQ